MNTYERHPHDREPAPPTTTLTVDSATRAAAERLLAAAETVIERGLSENSAAFLAAFRQISAQ
jgi:hypothetical protein